MATAATLARRDLILLGPVSSGLVTIAWPLVITGLASTATFLVVGFWLARLGGPHGALVAAAAAPLEQIVINVALAVGSGALPQLAQSVGKADGKAWRLLRTAAALALTFGSAAAVILVACSGLIARALVPSGDVAEPLGEYLVFIFLGLPVKTLTYVLVVALTSSGATHLTAARLVAEALALAVLTPLLMAGAGFGLRGVGAAGLVTGLLFNGATWLVLRRRAVALGLGDPRLAAPDLDTKSWRSILALGLPVQIGRVAQYLAGSVFVHEAARGGRADGTGFGAVYRLVYPVMLLSFAIARACGVMVAQNVAAGHGTRARRAVLLSSGVTIALCAVLAVGAPLSGLTQLLLPGNEAGQRAAADVLGWIVWSFAVLGANQILAECYLAIGKVRLSSGGVVVGQLLGVVVALTAPGPPLLRACAGFLVANGMQLALLLGLARRNLGPVFRDSGPKAAATR